MLEVNELVDEAMARYGNGREVVAAAEVIDLLLDIRLASLVATPGSETDEERVTSVT